MLLLQRDALELQATASEWLTDLVYRYCADAVCLCTPDIHARMCPTRQVEHAAREEKDCLEKFHRKWEQLDPMADNEKSKGERREPCCAATLRLPRPRMCLRFPRYLRVQLGGERMRLYAHKDRTHGHKIRTISYTSTHKDTCAAPEQHTL
jgi:hypothetical protein